MTKTRAKKLRKVINKRRKGDPDRKIDWKRSVDNWNKNRAARQDYKISGRNGRISEYVRIPKKSNISRISDQPSEDKKSSLKKVSFSKQLTTVYLYPRTTDRVVRVISDVPVPSSSRRSRTLKFGQKEKSQPRHVSRTVKHPWKPVLYFSTLSTEANKFPDSEDLLERSVVSRKIKLVPSYQPRTHILRATEIPVQSRDRKLNLSATSDRNLIATAKPSTPTRNICDPKLKPSQVSQNKSDFSSRYADRKLITRAIRQDKPQVERVPRREVSLDSSLDRPAAPRKVAPTEDPRRIRIEASCNRNIKKVYSTLSKNTPKRASLSNENFPSPLNFVYPKFKVN